MKRKERKERGENVFAEKTVRCEGNSESTAIWGDKREGNFR